MIKWGMLRGLLVAAALTAFALRKVVAAESIWIEAENLQGIHGYCFPDMDQKTAGHWALSGPGIAPEWTQGGESEWLSIACGPDDATAAAVTNFEVPEAAEWQLWSATGTGADKRKSSASASSKRELRPNNGCSAKSRSSMKMTS